MLNTTLRNEWKSTRFVHGLGIPQIKEALIEPTTMSRSCSFARLRSLKKPINQSVSELKYVQYTKNNAKHSALGRTHFKVHFGRTPTNLSVDLKLLQELILTQHRRRCG